MLRLPKNPEIIAPSKPPPPPSSSSSSCLGCRTIVEFSGVSFKTSLLIALLIISFAKVLIRKLKSVVVGGSSVGTWKFVVVSGKEVVSYLNQFYFVFSFYIFTNR